MQFERDAESSGIVLSVSDKGVLYFNQALIHMRVSVQRNGACMVGSGGSLMLFHLVSSFIRTLKLSECWKRCSKFAML